MVRRFLAGLFLLCICTLGAYAQSAVSLRDFAGVADSLSVLFRERTTVDNEIKLTRVMKRGDLLDFYFSSEMGEYPWRDDDIPWIKETICSLMPGNYTSFSIGNVYAKNKDISKSTVPHIGNSGQPSAYSLSVPDPETRPFVRRIGDMEVSRGMYGRTIALWQSHGKYYDEADKRWKWQRAPLHRTVEDMYTQSYVLPFLIPMLENAGAYIMTPRERDTQVREFIIDNDKAFTEARISPVRKSGTYGEQGSWTDAGTGFADPKKTYRLGDNPFTMGTARRVPVSSDGKATAVAKWIPGIEENGTYAVYVSYKTLTNSTSCAHYSVYHRGGKTEFSVNQNIGGGTWIYLGTFDMDADSYVELDNAVPQGDKVATGTIVTADAVKIGGGVGKYERGGSTSGVPSYMEGALYWSQWAGSGPEITEEWSDDYHKDYAGRGAWTTMMLKDKKVPFDMSLAFHSDAGSFPNDSIVGTLTIYTSVCDGATKLPGGQSRMVARSYADMVQTQVCDDIRAKFDTSWARRGIWDKSYSECRTTSVPGIILELLSHQNFADMKLGLDPSFRFTVSRAVYKGMLKFLSNMYGVPYVVQPLPVHSMSVGFGSTDGTAVVSWKATDDELEPTASAKGFILQTRVDDGVFDKGVKLENIRNEAGRCSVTVPVEDGHIYSYRVIAFNEGGRSFPSEVLSFGTPVGGTKDKVLIVNNFYRVSAPAWVDTPTYAGFDASTDSGVPYINDISYIGENYQNWRDLEWVDDDNPGFGASYVNKAGLKVAGNTFDFTFIHGKALMEAGYAFCSTSSEAWGDDAGISSSCIAADIICGKQVTTASASGATRFEVFSDSLVDRIREYTSNGGNIIISGAYIGEDVNFSIYPYEVDATKRAARAKFVESVLGYKWRTGFASPSGKVAGLVDVEFHTEPNEKNYCVENADGIIPASKKAESVMKYTDNGVSAAVFFYSGKYKVASFGFPLECIKDRDAMSELIKKTMKYIKL